MILLVFREERQGHLLPACQQKRRHVPAASGAAGEVPRGLAIPSTSQPVPSPLLCPASINGRAPLILVIALAELQIHQCRSASQKLIAAHLKSNDCPEIISKGGVKGSTGVTSGPRRLPSTQ